MYADEVRLDVRVCHGLFAVPTLPCPYIEGLFESDLVPIHTHTITDDIHIFRLIRSANWMLSSCTICVAKMPSHCLYSDNELDKRDTCTLGFC